MTVVLPFHAGDVDLAIGLLDWIQTLGKHPDHSALLVADAGMDWADCLDALELANSIFRCATLITNDKPTPGWIPGSNSLFAAAAQHMQGIGEPWLWIEPDATPLRKGWLDEIAKAYQTCGKPFIGSLVHHDLTNRPNPYFEGCGVYPADTWSRIKEVFNMEESWTLWCAAQVVPYAVNSPLFQHVWGIKDLPPTFAKVKTTLNTFTLSDVKLEAALFHRVKDGSLIDLLQGKFHVVQNGLVVVLPFCNKDGRQMIKVLRWMQRLGGCKSHSVLLAYDKSTLPDISNTIRQEANACFRQVTEFVYATPPNDDMTTTAKYVFRAVAWHIHHKMRCPYLWFEADMVPVKRGWLGILQDAYSRCGKSFFGPVIQEMGHFNGTAIYPADTWQRCPSLHTKNGDAWDTGMRDETRGFVADAMPLIQHAWARNGDRLVPCGYGELPYFASAADVKRMLSPQAVCFHRDKNLTLIDRLSEMGVA